MEVLAISVPVLLCVPRSLATAVSERMEVVDGEVRMVPVEQGVIEADLQPSRTHRLDERPDQVSSVRRGHHGIVGQGRIPEAEALVMLRREHHVAHPGVSGGTRPFVGIVKVGVEIPDIPCVGVRRDLLPAHDPLMASGQRVEPEVDEHAEPRLEKPSRVATDCAANHGSPLGIDRPGRRFVHRVSVRRSPW